MRGAAGLSEAEVAQVVDGLLAAAVVIGLAVKAAFGLWWADPLAGYVLVVHGVREARAVLAG
jgi:divalent metal cation (Fe/Co/Zn/Cd) transporter